MFGEDMAERAKEAFEIFRAFYDKTPAEKMFENILKNYIEQNLKNVANIKLIHRFFEQALKDGRANGGTSTRCCVFIRN